VTFSVQENATDPRYTSAGIYMPSNGGVTKWFSGDVYSVKLAAEHPAPFKNVGLHTAKMLFFYTPGGPEGLFTEGGDEPRPGVQVPTWGPERFEGHMLDLFEKYGLEALPEDV
jgi:hypothetical protein